MILDLQRYSVFAFFVCLFETVSFNIVPACTAWRHFLPFLAQSHHFSCHKAEVTTGLCKASLLQTFGLLECTSKRVESCFANLYFLIEYLDIYLSRSIMVSPFNLWIFVICLKWAWKIHVTNATLLFGKCICSELLRSSDLLYISHTPPFEGINI